MTRGIETMLGMVGASAHVQVTVSQTSAGRQATRSRRLRWLNRWMTTDEQSAATARHLAPSGGGSSVDSDGLSWPAFVSIGSRQRRREPIEAVFRLRELVAGELMTTPTNVAFDHWSISEPGSDRGLGRYAATLSTVLDADPRFNPVYVRKSVGKGQPSSLQLQRQISSLSKRVDLYHATVPEHLPPMKSLRWVCSIQDIIPLDLAAYRRFGLKTRLKYLNSKRADIILANSEYTASRVMQRLEVPSARIYIAPIPISQDFYIEDDAPRATRERACNEPYIVGLVDHRAPDPRKRYHWIEDLASELQGSGIRVVVTGRQVSPEQYPNCHILPPLSDRDLAALYRDALTFFYPSSYEGQGLPPIEAMAAGCPVLAFRNSSVAEMVGESDFLVHDPIPWESDLLGEHLPTHSMRECRERIENIASNGALRRELGKLARKRASEYKSEKLADGMADAYRGALR